MMRHHFLNIIILGLFIGFLSGMPLFAGEACDLDGVRAGCDPPGDAPPAGDQSYEDADLDDGRDHPDTPEPPDEPLDDGRGGGGDEDGGGEEDTAGGLNDGRGG